MSSDQPAVPNPVPPPDGERHTEELSEQPATLTPSTDAPRKRGRLVVIAGAGVLLVLAAVYIAGYLLAGDRLPRNTSVAGIALGGLSTEEATTKLTTEYAPRATAPLTVSVDGATHEIKPEAAGLGVDYAATVRAAGAGKSWHPAHIWRVLTGGGAVEPAVQVDDAKLSEAVGGMAGTVNKQAVNATAKFEGAEVKRTPGEQAVELDQDKLRDAIRRAYPETTQVSGETRRIDPIVTDADVDEAVKAYATPALSGPIKVDTGQGAFEVTPAMIGNASTFVEENGGLVGRTDGGKLYENARPAIKKLNFKNARNARYDFSGGSPTVVPSVDGAELKRENFEKVVMPALLTPNREVKAELTVTKPKLSTEDAEKQKPREVIGEFTTYWPHADYRNTNLGLAASRINGNTLAAGEVFSLDDTLGSRSNYVDGWVVAGARLKKENAGGISQSATTVFNAGWFAGLEDVEHQPHTMYFDRYPAGRESTIYSGHIDVKFRNTTDNAIYIQSYTSKSSPGGRGSITVKIWGTKKWDIESPEPTKSDYYNGRTITDNGADCNPQAASPGFTASYYRVFKQNGQVVKRENKSWKYNATDEVKCTKG